MDVLGVINAVLEVSGLKEKIGRSEQIIRLKQQFGIADIESLSRFEDVYAYALVAYAFDEEGLCKHRALVEFFKLKAVRDVFRVAYRDNDPAGWLGKGQAIAQYELGDKLPVAIDPKRELGVFAAVFLEVVKETRSLKEIRQERQLEQLRGEMGRSLQAIQSQLQQLPTLEAINQQVNQLSGASPSSQTLALPAAAQNSSAVDLAHRLGEWFEVLDYDRDPDYEKWTADYFEWVINFPLGRRRVSRTLVRGVAGVVEMADLQDFARAVENAGADEGWLVGNRRVSQATRQAVQTAAAYEEISCYTFDELLDEDADFSKYLDWLEAEILTKRVDTEYLPLACRKDELDPTSQRKIGVSVYGEDDGWIDGYVDRWLDDPAKEHLSVLGEFGTGKTWFVLHYAWAALQRYREAKRRGTERPRIPVVVPLRDYAKAVSVESLFSEFFFRKHEILKNYSVFEQLNRMGKLLLIFDGFDEMAARVNRQAMIDNFWELAKVVVPGAKAILTCRTEHFPDAMEGRQLLGAELESSTAILTGETPQFEVLELEKFEDKQIAQLLKRKAQASTVEEVMGNEQLLDLARRPVMVDLILEALPDIEAGKPVDMARVYLYAVTRKMENDIQSKRTFTSLADKLYFLCELSWEMLSTNQMSLNYRAFPEQLKEMFVDRVKEEKELDHWRYDMMGQTMLIRNSEGDYSPAHRSLLEFFVAYNIVACLGVMSEDFTDIARLQSHLNLAESPKEHTWTNYFSPKNDIRNGFPQTAPLRQFEPLEFEELLPLLSQSKIVKAVLDLACLMLEESVMKAHLLPLIQKTRGEGKERVAYFGGNIVQLMLARDSESLEGCDLSLTVLKGVNIENARLRRTSLEQADLSGALVTKMIGSISAVAFSPDGKHIAIGDSKGVLQVWNLETEQAVIFCSNHADWIWSIAFNPDGNVIASGSGDHTVRLWSSISGKCLLTLSGHTDWVWSVAFSPDGNTVASSSGDSTIKLWSVASGSCFSTLNGHKAGVRDIAFNPKGSLLASGSADRTVKIWSAASGECIMTMTGHSDRVRSVDFSPDGKTVASGSGDQTVKTWSVSSGECISTFLGHSDWVWSIAFSPDGTIIASGGVDQTIRLRSIDSGDETFTLSGHSNWVRSIDFSPDGKVLASGSADQTVRLWSVSSGNCLSTITGTDNGIRAAVFSPDGKTIAASGANKTLKLWSVDSGNCVSTLEGHSDWVLSIAFSPNGKLLVSGSADRTIKLWSVDSSECLLTLKGHTNWVRSVVFSPDGDVVASGSYDETIKLWSVASGKCLSTLRAHSNWVRAVAFSPDGDVVASSSADKTIKLWSVSSGERLLTLEGHDSIVWSIAFSPDSQTLVSGGNDRTLKLWSTVSGNCISTMKGHKDGLRSVAFGPDGKIVASGSNDHSLKLWSVTSGECLITLSGHQDRVRTVAFSPSGESLVSGSFDESIRLWDIGTGKCQKIIYDRLCEALNITGIKGLTNAQHTTLKLMGAVDYDAES